MGVDHSSYQVETLIAAEAVAARVRELAAEISAHFADTERLLVVSLLRGGFIFTADLVRLLEALPVEIDFLQAASYGDEMEGAKEVKIMKDLSRGVEGLDVLLVDDIIDGGRTLAKVVALLESRQPKRLEICALLDKPSRRQVEVDARWIGFAIPDEFVVGYGLDYAQRHRQLPYIGKVVRNR